MIAPITGSQKFDGVALESSQSLSPKQRPFVIQKTPCSRCPTCRFPARFPITSSVFRVSSILPRHLCPARATLSFRVLVALLLAFWRDVFWLRRDGFLQSQSSQGTGPPYTCPETGLDSEQTVRLEFLKRGFPLHVLVLEENERNPTPDRRHINRWMESEFRMGG